MRKKHEERRSDRKGTKRETWRTAKSLLAVFKDLGAAAGWLGGLVRAGWTMLDKWQFSESRFGWLLSGLLLSGFLLSGCHAPQQVAATGRGMRTDSLAMIRADSSWSSHLQHQSGRTRLCWQQVLLSPPDSSGRQYPKLLSSLVAEQVEEQTRQDTLHAYTHRQALATETASGELQTVQTAPKKNFPYWVIGVLGVVGVWGVYRGRK